LVAIHVSFLSFLNPMAAVTAKLVKELRDKTGAGMMDCKKALGATDGDTEKAVEWLRQKGIASAEKKSSRTAAEGSIGSYIHTGARVGVLIEINCETDFVARGDMFQELLRDVSMQVAACPNVEYVTTDEIPAEISEREKAIEMGRDDLEGKPEKMKEKIVEGRIAKRLKELALMEQPFIKDSSITVAELVKQTAGKIGENVKVRRFTRYTLGEGIEVEDNDYNNGSSRNYAGTDDYTFGDATMSRGNGTPFRRNMLGNHSRGHRRAEAFGYIVQSQARCSRTAFQCGTSLRKL
jgi:elongation factor Ts